MEFASSSSILTGSGGNFFIRFGGLLKLQMGKKWKKKKKKKSFNAMVPDIKI